MSMLKMLQKYGLGFYELDSLTDGLKKVTLVLRTASRNFFLGLSGLHTGGYNVLADRFYHAGMSNAQVEATIEILCQAVDSRT
jgi:hypothetical protein